MWAKATGRRHTSRESGGGQLSTFYLLYSGLSAYATAQIGRREMLKLIIRQRLRSQRAPGIAGASCALCKAAECKSENGAGPMSNRARLNAILREADLINDELVQADNGTPKERPCRSRGRQAMNANQPQWRGLECAQPSSCRHTMTLLDWRQLILPAIEMDS